MGHHLHTKEFVVGAAVGSLLGSVAALLIAPKAGEELRQDLCDGYCNIAGKTQDFADKSRSMAKNIGDQTCDWACKAKSFVNDAGQTIKRWTSGEEEEDTTRDLLIGGLIGGVLGAAVGLLLAPKPGQELRRNLADTYEDISERTQDFAEDMSKRGKKFAKNAHSRANKWLDLARNVVEDLTEDVQEKGEEWVDQVKGLVNNKRMNDVLDWAHLGYRLWQGSKSRR